MCRSGIYSNDIPLENSESTFNCYLVYPFLKSVVNCLSDNKHNCFSLPSEKLLSSMTKQLKLIQSHEDDWNCYKADGVYRLRKLNDLEILLVETSEEFKSTNKTKKAYDHHKGTFGMLSMLKFIADEFRYTSLSSFCKVKIFFLHAAGK